ncbi:MAG TPA: hypothetical protein VHO25_05605 [Polyangiaceae bacterium]|nr:hypothetical protein [Polyangiaceae bacterium]
MWDRLPKVTDKGYIVVDGWTSKTFEEDDDNCKYKFSGLPPYFGVYVHDGQGWQEIATQDELVAVPPGEYKVKICVGHSQCLDDWHGQKQEPLELVAKVEKDRVAVIRTMTDVVVDCGGMFMGDESSRLTLDVAHTSSMPFSGTTQDIPEMKGFLGESDTVNILVFDNVCRISRQDKTRALAFLDGLDKDSYLNTKTRDLINKGATSCLVPINPSDVKKGYWGETVVEK